MKSVPPNRQRVWGQNEMLNHVLACSGLIEWRLSTRQDGAWRCVFRVLQDTYTNFGAGMCTMGVHKFVFSSAGRHIHKYRRAAVVRAFIVVMLQEA
jgi:hypothetical protein